MSPEHLTSKREQRYFPDRASLLAWLCPDPSVCQYLNYRALPRCQAVRAARHWTPQFEPPSPFSQLVSSASQHLQSPYLQMGKHMGKITIPIPSTTPPHLEKAGPLSVSRKPSQLQLLFVPSSLHE